MRTLVVRRAAQPAAADAVGAAAGLVVEEVLQADHPETGVAQPVSSRRNPPARTRAGA
ncbi:MAG TPA: hypothetical protein VFP72_12695 [Kineosporiaceae bacterium]|nr:hypothetical protein [Kineosporiaceae bacterium]